MAYELQAAKTKQRIKEEQMQIKVIERTQEILVQVRNLVPNGIGLQLFVGNLVPNGIGLQLFVGNLVPNKTGLQLFIGAS